MKSLKISVIIAVLATGISVLAETGDVSRLAFDPTMVLKLKVTSDNRTDDNSRSIIREGKLKNEISFWTIVDIRIRIYRDLSKLDHESGNNYHPDRIPGYKYLIDRSRIEIKWPYDPYMFDPYRSFFREGDFLYRSTRSLYHEYYSSGGYYHN